MKSKDRVCGIGIKFKQQSSRKSGDVTKFYFKDYIEHEVGLLSNQKRQWIIRKREAIDK